MKIFHLNVSAAALIALAVSADGARAQAPGQITNPYISPYLNLLRPGNSAAGNYLGLVRPELDLRNAAGTLQQQVAQEQQQINAVNNRPVGPLVTGHAATFFNTSHYYPGSRLGGARR